MRCHQCQHEAPVGAEFCPECGVKFILICARCGTSNLISHKFCPRCGNRLTPTKEADAAEASPRHSYTPPYLAEKILTQRPTFDEERKQVTVLFADIKSSLELLTDRDPEDAGKLFDAVLERMVASVHRYEGTVHRVMGDGVMALFGAPLAHEDHALRACYAALMMQDAIKRYSAELRRTEGINVQVRVGLNSGEVIVHSIRPDLQMDYTIVGLTSHLASRMEQIATPGSILITPDVLSLVEGYVEIKPLGPVPVKGLPAPMEVYEVVGAGAARSRLQAAAARGLTRFVGRAREMDALRDALREAGSGHGQIVAVAGEAGIGKSRLLHEFIHSQDTRGWLVLETNTVSYGSASPYLPIIDLLKSYFKIDVRDSVRMIRERVTGKVILLDQSLQDAIPPILYLLDALPDDDPFRGWDPLQRRQQTIQAIKRLIQRESRLQPIVIVFEDLHWNDSLSLGLLDGVIDSLPDERVLFLISYRSEFQDSWKGRAYHRELILDPLPRASIEGLLLALIGNGPTLVAVKALLIERAEGNPFFLEELVRTLVETHVFTGERGQYRLATPVANIKVPPQVQAVIAARIDRLPPEAKHLLQEASVIGKDVPFSLLKAISDRSEEELHDLLEELQSGEFLYESELFPDLEYTFKHALTHKVAYEGLLQERRREIHARIVDSIESLYSNRLNENIERLAQHAFIGAVWPKAVTYLRQAGAKAIERPANREAVALFQQALEALKHLPEDRHSLEEGINIRFDIRNALQPLGELPQILDYLREAEQLATRLDDRRRLGWVASYLCEHFRMHGDSEGAALNGERALAIAQSLSDVPMQVVTRLPMGLLHHALGDYRQAIALFKSNVNELKGELLQDRLGLFGLPSVFSRAFLAYCFAELGEFAEGIMYGEEGVRIANAAHHPYSQVYAYLGVGYLCLRQGNLERAISVLENAVDIGQLAQIPVGLAYGASYLGYALALTGRSQEGLQFLEQTTTPPISTKFVARHSLRVAYLGEAYLLAGRSSAAAEAANQALELARTHRERGHEAYALRLLGDVTTMRGEFADAEKQYQGATRLAQELGMRPLLAHCYWGVSRLARRMRNAPSERKHLALARGLFRDMNMVGWLYRMDGEFSEPGERPLSAANDLS